MGVVKQDFIRRKIFESDFSSFIINSDLWELYNFLLKLNTFLMQTRLYLSTELNIYNQKNKLWQKSKLKKRSRYGHGL